MRCPGRRWIVACAVAGWAVCPLAADPSPADSDEVVARCGLLVIRRTEVETVLRRLGLAEMPAGPQRLRAEAAVLEQLLDERILLAELDRLGIAAGEEEIDAALERLRGQVAGQGGDFDGVLAAGGRTQATVREQLALDIRLDKFVRQQITPAALAAVFERNRRELDGTRLRVSHVLLRPDAGGEGDQAARLLAEAATIRAGIVSGRTSFAAAARMHSAAPSRRSGGDVGWIGRDGPMAEAFSSQAFRLARGGVSEPFVTAFGVHVVTVTEVEPGRVGIDALRPRLEKLLATQLVQGLVAAGRERTPVEFAANAPHFDPATLGRPPDERPVIGAGGAAE